MRLGFLINPIAGMGGATGLKGTDGGALQHAIAKGATPIAPKKARQALSELLTLKDQLEVVAADGVMGATPARALGFSTTVVGLPDTGETTARHSRAAMQAMCDAEVNLILFVGGDGTARDLLAASESADIAIIGAPSGVKMHSGVFATSPRVAGSLARRFLTATNRDAMLRVVEIVDRQIVDGVDYSEPHCFGVMRSPHAPMATLHPKQAAMRPRKPQSTAHAGKSLQKTLLMRHLSLAPARQCKPSSAILAMKEHCWVLTFFALVNWSPVTLIETRWPRSFHPEPPVS